MVVAGSGNLRIKEGSKATGGGKSTKSTYDFAQLIQDNIQGFKHITAMNDYYHQSKEYLKKGGNVNSSHRRGQGIDFSLTDPKNSNQVIQELKQLANMYGYDVGIVQDINLRSRKHFNYIKTAGAIISGSINNTIKEKIAKILEKHNWIG